MKKVIAAFLAACFLISVSSCRKKPVEDSGVSGGEDKNMVNLAQDSAYFFSYEDALKISDNDGKRLTDPQNTNPVKCEIRDVAKTGNDWYGTQHSYSLFEEKTPCFYIKDDFGFPATLKNAEIAFDKNACVPMKVELFWSDDGYNFNFFAGQMQKTEQDQKAVFSLSLENPVTAKAIKFFVYSETGKSIDVLYIKALGEKKEDRVLLSKDCKYTHDGAPSELFSTYADTGFKKLTDGVFGGFDHKDKSYAYIAPKETDGLMNRKVINVTIDLGSEKDISEVITSLYSNGNQGSEADFVSVKYSADGNSYSDFCMTSAEGAIVNTSDGKTHKKTIYPAMRNHTVEARFVKVQIFAKNVVVIDEISVYGSDSPVKEPEYNFFTVNNEKAVGLPIIRGGFYAFFLDYIEGYSAHHYFDDYRIYLQLKGYRELGMDTVIIGGQNIEVDTKLTLAEPPKELSDKGYKKGVGGGVYDLNESVLKAADKLGLNVYLSTMISKAYSSLPKDDAEKATYTQNAVSDAAVIIKTMHERYKEHKSFYGYYLADETCDQWLFDEKNAGTSFTRFVYEEQSKVIRSLDEKYKIAIAPAAWRCDKPSNFGENLYNLLKNNTEGGRPVIDVVMMQDCLGREQSITVKEEVYTKYKEYLEACSEGVRRTGAEFHNDAEIFDVLYRAKRFEETKKSLELLSKYSTHTLVFDLPHYLSSQTRGSYNSYAFFDNDCILSMYAKYVSEIKAKS